MKKSTKGALAAGAAAFLLLGGAGTLAYWTADGTIEGGTIESGELDLTVPECDDWTLDGGAAFDPDVDLLVPGDDLTRVCTLTLTAAGEHIGADLQIDDAAMDGEGGLAEELDVEASFTVDGAEDDSITGAGEYEIEATVVVTFPYGGPVSEDPRDNAQNASQDDLAALDDIAIIAVQTHEAA